jgi:Reverse transcriptase-like
MLHILPVSYVWFVLVPCLVSSNAMVQGAHVVLRVQFDGSLRSPSDPGFPTASVCRIGTAAASCQLLDVNNNNNNNNGKAFDFHKADYDNYMLWLGGKVLDSNALVNNSAEAEYEGLLMGLDKAVNIVEEQQLSLSALSCTQILVQGDCKTVIDQLRESSQPRKLEKYYLRAREILDKIDVPLEFQHIPRDENTLCDGLCTALRTQILEPDEWRMALAGIHDDPSRAIHSLVRCIPFSKRPQLYARLASLALEQGDHQRLVQVGEQMELEAKTVWSASVKRHSTKKLQAWGVAMQLQGFQGLDTRKSLQLAVAKERKNRFLLQDQNQFLQAAMSSAVMLNDSQNIGEACDRALPGSQDQRLSSMFQDWVDRARDSQQWNRNDCLWLCTNPGGKLNQNARGGGQE